MSLYRQPGRAGARLIAGVAATALLCGGGVGYAIGAAGGDDSPPLHEVVAALRGDLEPLRAALQLIRTEYPQAVRDGRVVAPTEYAAAKADVTRARATLAAHAQDLAVLAPAKAGLLAKALSGLAAAVDHRASPDEVRRRAGAATAALDATLPRAGSGAGNIVVIP
jgi:hypothetical protein